MNLVRRSADAPAGAAKPPVLFDPFQSLWTDSPFGSLFEGFFRDQVRWPAVDIFERDGDIFIRAEVPGMTEKDIDVKLEGNLLTLRGEKKTPESSSYPGRTECWYGSFMRSFTLPDGVDRDSIKAEYRNGILTIQVPRDEKARPHSIPVTVH